MALPKLYEQIVWHNNTTPAINEDNLNSMSQAIDDIDDRVIDIASTIMEDVPAIEEALEALDPPIRVVKDFAGVQALTDALEKNAADVKVKVTPKQDLHGYSKPWAGGAGKNKFQVTATTSTVQGVTLTINSDGTIKCSNNTASGLIAKSLGSFTGLASVKFAGCPSGGSGTTYVLQLYDVTSGTYGQSDYGSGGSATLDASHTYQLQLVIRSGVNPNGLVFKPMVCLSTESNVDYAHFEPYTNICPITGFTEAKVTRTGKNLLNNQASTSTVQGIKYTVNSDKSITIANTATAQSVLTLSANDNSLPAGTYIYSKGSTNANVYCNINAKKNNAFVRNIISFYAVSEQSFTLDYNGYDSIDILIYVPSGKAPNTTIYPMIRSATIADATYEPYTGTTYTISLGDTRYLAELDVTSGELTVKGGIADYGDLNWYRSTSYTHPFFFADINGMSTTAGDVVSSCNESIASRQGSDFGQQAQNNQCCKGTITKQFFVRNDSYSDAPAFKTAMTGQKVVYPLATPVTVQLTATEVALLYAYNTLWADTGDLALTYDASGVLRIANSKLDIDTFKSIVASSSDFADFKSKVAAL